ncbi:MAG: hypothetical protein K8S54_20975 [Spirochaetia bacterium]|nr:hypothetical protein [Spirochaetia bacterium]
MNMLLRFVLLICISSPLLAEQPVSLSLKFPEAKIISGTELALFPAREKLPGFIGSYSGFRKDTIMARVKCAVNESVTVLDAEGNRTQEYAGLYRIELYRIIEDGKGNDPDDWEYIAWYRFTDSIAHNACKSIRDTAVVASTRRPLLLDLQIEPTGGLHRNIVKAWKLEGN